jgi:hypothetical protein
MGSTRGAKWVRRMGVQAARHGKTAFWSALAAGVVCANSVFFISYFFAHGLIESGFNAVLGGLTFGVSGALFQILIWGTIALLWYERHEFYRIIQEQEQRIAQLEIEANRTELKS